VSILASCSLSSQPLSTTRPCTLAGVEAPLSFTISYAAPEVVAAYEAGARTHIVHPAADIWALGLIAFEMLTGEPAFPPLASMADIMGRISGREAMLWEGPRRPELLHKLRVFKANVLDCLQRDPTLRPPMTAVVRGWEHVFQTVTTTSKTHTAVC
jgi:serine/threonine protein kinase